RIYGGYDGGVEAGFDGVWSPSQFETLKETLCVAKQAADDNDLDASYVELGGWLWKVSAKGTGGNGPKYKFVLEHHGIKLYIHNNPKSGIQPVRVRFGFHALCKCNLFECVRTLKKVLLSIGFRITVEKISRVDMQILLERPIQDFVDAMHHDTVVTLCRGSREIHENIRTGRLETILYQSGTTEMEIYDKRAQILQTDKETYELFRRFVLGSGSLPDELTRVEFRFRRDALRRYGINTFEELQASALALIQIATSEWFRILDRAKDKGNEARQKICPLWQEVIDQFEYYFSSENEENIERTRQDLKNYTVIKESPKVEMLVKQAAGCLASVCAFCLDTVDDVEQLFDYGVERLRTCIDAIAGKYHEKRLFNEVVLGYVPGEVNYEEAFDPRLACNIGVVNRRVDHFLATVAGVPF
ncbi:MAG: hypothetical protein LBC02_08310, partial [Planctomycetaceae bacterium]|nr:hypothetical protein [Planctomycetaceae bacterium]